MKILLADNQSRDAKTAAQFLVGLGPPREAEVLLTYVIDVQNWPALPATGRSLQLQQQIDMMRTETSDAARDYLSHAVEQFRDLPLRVDSIVTEGSPAVEILRIIEEQQIDLAVIGTRGRTTITRFLLGSVSEHVLNHASCSVLVVKEPPRWIRRGRKRGLKVVLPIDGSTEAFAAVGFLKQLGLPTSSTVTVMHVTGVHSSLASRLLGLSQKESESLFKEVVEASRQATAQLLDAAKRDLEQTGIKAVASSAKGQTGDEILKAVKSARADMVVLGARGLTGLERFMLGSVSRQVARHAPCSVLVVRKKSDLDKARRSPPR